MGVRNTTNCTNIKISSIQSRILCIEPVGIEFVGKRTFLSGESRSSQTQCISNLKTKTRVAVKDL